MKIVSAVAIFLLIAINLVGNSFGVPVSGAAHTVSKVKLKNSKSILCFFYYSKYVWFFHCLFHRFVSLFVHRLGNQWWKFHNGIVYATSNTTSIWWDDAETTECQCFDGHWNNSTWKLDSKFRKKLIFFLNLKYFINIFMFKSILTGGQIWD